MSKQAGAAIRTMLEKSPEARCNDSMNWIVDNQLAVGDMDASANMSLIKKHNIGGIVTSRENLSRPASFYKNLGVSVLHIPISDHPSTKIYKYFNRVFWFIEYCVKHKKAVLVHCAAGISRSTTLVISYMMRKYKMSAMQAAAVVQQRRPCCYPNPGFLTQLVCYQKALVEHGMLPPEMAQNVACDSENKTKQ
jgi:dual specificity MAP kinase phosphatase